MTSGVFEILEICLSVFFQKGMMLIELDLRM